MWEWISDNKEFLTLIIAIIGMIIGYFNFKKELSENKNQFEELSAQNLKDRISSTTSTFRQNWLQEFRKDISRYYSFINGLQLLTNYSDKYFNNLSNSEYDLLLRLNVNNEVDRKIENKILSIREFYSSFFQLLKYDNWDICDDIIYKHKFSDLEEKREQAHKEMAKKVKLDLHMEDHPISEEEVLRINSSYEQSVKLLKRDTKEMLIDVINRVKDELFVEFRIYLKTEWERIKEEIENGKKSFDFKDMFDEIKDNVKN